MINVATILELSARRYPTKTAIVCGETRLTYRELDRRANRVAAGLRAAGVEPGQRVAVTCPNVAEFPMLFFGILRLGAVIVPLNPLLKRDEIAYRLNDSGATAYVCFEGTQRLAPGPDGWSAFQRADACELFWLIATGVCDESDLAGARTFAELTDSVHSPVDSERRSTDDTCEILYTSGTTGRPKGAEITHANLMMNATAVGHLMDEPHEQIHLVFVPLFHAFAQGFHLIPALQNGATVVLLPRFDPVDVIDSLEREKVTLFGGVPTMFWSILHCPRLETFDRKRDAPHLHYTFSAGQSMPIELAARFEQKFQVPVIELYGMTEVSVATMNPLKSPRTGSVGLPISGAELRVVDPDMNDTAVGERGEIVMRGPHVTKGYLGHAEQTAEAFRGGWFHSGDVAYRDEDGYLYIVDRIKDVIIRGGENVYPREIEERLLEHPAVSLTAVIGVADEKFGEEVKAFVVLGDGARVASDELISWSKERMANYPRIVEIVDSLPTGPTGKVLKLELRK